MANATAANVLAGAIADAEDDEDIVDPMQFLANDVTYTDDGPDADDDMDGGDGDNVQPPFLTSLGLTHINHVRVASNMKSKGEYLLKICFKHSHRTPTSTATRPPTMATLTTPPSCCRRTPSDQRPVPNAPSAT